VIEYLARKKAFVVAVAIVNTEEEQVTFEQKKWKKKF